MAGTTVFEVIAVDRGDDYIAQAHGLDGAGQVTGFFDIQWVGAAMRHITERTAAGADIAHDHEGGRALAEAFVQIGAGGLLADGMQALVTQDVFEFLDLGAVA